MALCLSVRLSQLAATSKRLNRSLVQYLAPSNLTIILRDRAEMMFQALNVAHYVCFCHGTPTIASAINSVRPTNAHLCLPHYGRDPVRRAVHLHQLRHPGEIIVAKRTAGMRANSQSTRPAAPTQDGVNCL